MKHLNREMRAKCLHLLAEGVSIRAAARLTGVSKTTILKLIEDAGRVAGAPIPTGKHATCPCIRHISDALPGDFTSAATRG